MTYIILKNCFFTPHNNLSKRETNKKFPKGNLEGFIIMYYTKLTIINHFFIPPQVIVNLPGEEIFSALIMLPQKLVYIL